MFESSSDHKPYKKNQQSTRRGYHCYAYGDRKTSSSLYGCKNRESVNKHESLEIEERCDESGITVAGLLPEPEFGDFNTLGKKTPISVP